VPRLRLDGWRIAPRVGVIVPDEGEPGWCDAAFWCSLLDAWGVPASRVGVTDVRAARWTTLIVPAPAVDARLTEELRALDGSTLLLTGEQTEPARRLERGPRVIRFGSSAESIEPANAEDLVDAAEDALRSAALEGLISIWRWPSGKRFALVVDGDVDHPTGVDPECSRYVRPAIETARLAGFDAYGIFVAAANVEAEPDSFPPGTSYYNHSFTHPYSHWNDRPWESLSEDEMAEEITRSERTFRKLIGAGDEGIFRLPHFQMDACDRTYDVLERLGYRADSSIGGNVSITGGLPFHPARRPWSGRDADAAYARSHPYERGRRPFLQLPISTDPTDPGFAHGCCSYNTLNEGVRARTAEPDAYEEVLQEVLDRAANRRGLAHLFIDPPDAGYGRLTGDNVDYASAVERWLARAVARDDVAIMTTAELARWWLSREAAVDAMSARVEGETLVVDLPDQPAGAAIQVIQLGTAGAASADIVLAS
jgi:hypothetical protein